MNLKISAYPAPELEAPFQRTEGWIGADGSYSVVLDRHRVLWLFSDTFVGQVSEGKRIDTTMINNSVAIQRLDVNDSAEFFYNSTHDGIPEAFVTPSEGDGYFWLFDGALTAKGLYLFLLRVVPDNSNPSFPFRVVGMSLGHVTNPADPPDRWSITQRRVPFAHFTRRKSIFFGSATLAVGAYIYIYGLNSLYADEKGKKISAMCVARVPEDSFGDFGAWRFWSGDAWVSDYHESGCLVAPMATEFSVSYLPGIKQYAAVYTEGGISGKITVRFSKQPEGPWGDATPVYECPDKQWHRAAYCYAAKAHPELSSSPNELVVSYACNSTHFPDLFNDARLYWPRFIRLTISEKECA